MNAMTTQAAAELDAQMAVHNGTSLAYEEPMMRIVATTHTHDRVTPRAKALATNLHELALQHQAEVRVYGKGYLVYGVPVVELQRVVGCHVVYQRRCGGWFCTPLVLDS